MAVVSLRHGEVEEAYSSTVIGPEIDGVAVGLHQGRTTVPRETGNFVLWVDASRMSASG